MENEKPLVPMFRVRTTPRRSAAANVENLAAARRIETQCKMQSENYEVQTEDLHAILHFVIFTLHFVLHPRCLRLCRAKAANGDVKVDRRSGRRASERQCR